LPQVSEAVERKVKRSPTRFNVTPDVADTGAMQQQNPVLGALIDYDPCLRGTDLMREAERRHDVELLISGLSNTDRIVRLYAASGLGTLQESRGIAPLLKLLQTSDWLLRSAAIKALTHPSRRL
jgi:hypothetical protein